MNVQNMAIKDIKPFKRNAKKHDERQIKNVMESIRQFGIAQPLVVDKDNILIIGHCRLIACKRLQMEEVPVVRMDELTEEQVAKLRLLDNKLNESEWDMDLLADDVPLLDFSDFDIDWGLPEIGEITEQDEEEDLFDDIEKMEKHYGVPYQGNKSRIADIIVKLLPEGARLVDLFGGGWSNNPLRNAER